MKTLFNVQENPIPKFPLLDWFWITATLLWYQLNCIGICATAMTPLHLKLLQHLLWIHRYIDITQAQVTAVWCLRCAHNNCYNVPIRMGVLWRQCRDLLYIVMNVRELCGYCRELLFFVMYPVMRCVCAVCRIVEISLCCAGSCNKMLVECLEL